MIFGERTDCHTEGDGHSDGCYKVSSFSLSLSVLKVLPVFCFAYNVHCTHSLVFAEMGKPKSLTKMDAVSAYALGFCAIVYIICGLVGYWCVVPHYTSTHSPPTTYHTPHTILQVR
jgi:amino acid permease